MKHEHTFVVRHLNGEGIQAPKSLAGYYWRISICEGEEGCGTWNSQGSFDPFPIMPRLGQPLEEFRQSVMFA